MSSLLDSLRNQVSSTFSNLRETIAQTGRSSSQRFIEQGRDNLALRGFDESTISRAENAALGNFASNADGGRDLLRNRDPFSPEDFSRNTNNNFGNQTSTNTTAPLTLTAGTAQMAYVAYYGRPADADVGAENFWDGVLRRSNVSYSPRGGDPLTGQEEVVYDRIINNFGNSDEANRLFGGLTNAQRVNLVYNNAFGRDAEQGGLDYWVPRLNDGRVTLAEFALKIALGAQNQDVIALRNKIESARRFSGSIDTFAEREAYRGANAEIFGRQFLANYGPTIAPQSVIDQALADFTASV